MKKNPEIRKLATNVWSLDLNELGAPNIVVMAAPSMIKIRLDELSADDMGMSQLEETTLNILVAEQFIKLAEKLKSADFNKE